MAKGARPGAVALCLIAPDLPGETEIPLPQDYPLTPQIKGALKSLPGVVAVEEV
jgi:DNA polymerase-3 subunit alpha